MLWIHIKAVYGRLSAVRLKLSAVIRLRSSLRYFSRSSVLRLRSALFLNGLLSIVYGLIYE